MKHLSLLVIYTDMVRFILRKIKNIHRLDTEVHKRNQKKLLKNINIQL